VCYWVEQVAEIIRTDSTRSVCDALERVSFAPAVDVLVPPAGALLESRRPLISTW
jgi:hypothetical protein